MKNLTKGILIGIAMSAMVAFTASEYTVSNKTAEVESYQNVKIFTDCKPVKEYEYLGTVKGRMTMTGQYEAVRNGLIKNAKDKYPHCDAIILSLVNGGVDRADVIKFK